MPFARDAGAEAVVERVGVRDDVAVLVDDREVRRLRRLVRRGIAGAEILAVRRVGGIDRLRALLRVLARDQALDRDLHEIGVAEELGAVGEGAAHDFDDRVHVLR